MAQQNKRQIKRKKSEKDIEKCGKSTTTRHSFKTTTHESKAQSMSPNASQEIAVKEQINYEMIDVFNESNVEECDERQTFAQPFNSTTNGSINESLPSIHISNIDLNNEMMRRMNNNFAAEETNGR